MPTDYKKTWKQLYSAPAAMVTVVEPPPMQFLMADGAGDPNTAPEYAAAVAALYSVAYGLKFALKKQDVALDYTVMPLEGLWWAESMEVFLAGRREHWRWTMMIAQPVDVPPEMFATVIDAVARAKTSVAQHVRLEQFHEGRAAQMLHSGPYTTEAPNIARLHAFIEAQGGRLSGKHHEIYLSDPRRTAPDKLRTILRQPFAQGG